MAKKGRDLSRGRLLTPEEAAHYREIRKEVMAEIVPATSSVVRETVDKLRDMRLQLQMSLADMEKSTGMTRANLCRLENESRNVQLRTLQRYARALGCRIEVHLVPIGTHKLQSSQPA